MIGDWLERHLIAPMSAVGIEVQADAHALLLLACHNQLRACHLSEAELYRLIEAMSPDPIAAYRFKYGDAPLTFGRAVRLLADVAERVTELRNEQARRAGG